MKKLLLIALSVNFLLFSCNNRIVFKNHKTEECKTYYHFIKKNWINDGSCFYHFKDFPEYWNPDIYGKFLKDECIIGLTKRELIKLFGTPTKEFTSNQPNTHLIIYCTTLDCNETLGSRKGHNIIFNLGDSNKVVDITTRPPAIYY